MQEYSPSGKAFFRGDGSQNLGVVLLGAHFINVEEWDDEKNMVERSGRIPDLSEKFL